ncbi:MAG: N-acetylmuramoyl-L-alanine amidase [Bacteroidaceae bacterium]|nr:N-acetylmuramoyl-L-alanine amidase [Bacteroidaceae bacterium]
MPSKNHRIKRLRRHINEIILHCTDTKPAMDVGVKEITQWHRAKGWLTCGYHFVIRRDGTVEQGRDLADPGAHCYNHNAESIGVCYVGGQDENGKPADTRTPEQRIALDAIVKTLHAVFPDADIRGHHDINPAKDCPCFDVGEYQYLMMDED